MNKKKIEKKDNVVNFPSKLNSIEKEIEAIIDKVLSIDKFKSWLNGDYKVVSELDIYSTLDDSVYRPDRLFFVRSPPF